MNQKVKVGNSGVVTLTDKNYKASGGEGSIYVNGGMAYKLYHEPDKKQFPPKKMQELAAIKNPQVVIPQEMIYDPTDAKPLGYTTRYVDNVEPLVKLFTRTFKNDNNISFKMINELVKQIQLVISDVHATKCLIVDLNELNILAGITSSSITPWFIDTDSYCTPSFKATAIMDSVRDRRVTIFDKAKQMHYRPDEMSDWFSFAVIAFNLYTNIHPFRGNHANYKPRDKSKQMDDGVSVFHPGVRVPPSVNDFKVIPPRHLDWFKLIFLNNDRCAPPIADSSVPMLVPTQVVTIQGTDRISVSEVNAYDSAIMDVFTIMGLYYIATKSHIYTNKKEIGTHTAKKILLCAASDGTIIAAQQDINDKIYFRDLTKADPVGTAVGSGMFRRNSAIYTMSRGKLIENSFAAFGNKIIHKAHEAENVSDTTATMYDGCVVQDLLGKMFITFPYKLGSCFSKHFPQLDGYRVIAAKADKNVIVVLGEKNGQYDRFIIVFDKHYTKSDIRKVDDVAYSEIVFTTLDNGLCLLLASPTELELFSTAARCEVINDPPFDSTMKLFSTSDGAFFINNNSIHQITKK